MSIPHTGRLAARINGIDCTFDGNTWKSSDSRLAARLNSVMAGLAVTHLSIFEVATNALEHAGLTSAAEILSWEPDSWPPDSLPDGAID